MLIREERFNLKRSYFDKETGTIKIRDLTQKKKRKSVPRLETVPKYMKKIEIDTCLNCPLKKCNGNCNILRELDYGEE